MSVEKIHLVIIIPCTFLKVILLASKEFPAKLHILLENAKGQSKDNGKIVFALSSPLPC